MEILTVSKLKQFSVVKRERNPGNFVEKSAQFCQQTWRKDIGIPENFKKRPTQTHTGGLGD
jgi:hypothetical protein